MNLVELFIPKPDDTDTVEAMTMVTYAKSFTIESASDSVKAQEARQDIVTRAKTLDEKRKSMTRPIDAAKKAIMDFFAPTIGHLNDAVVILDRKLVGWEELQKRIRLDAQRKEDERAAAERRRLQAIAEAAAHKAAAEAAAKREAAEKAAAEGRAAEAAKLRAQAASVEERGLAKVEAFESRAATVVSTIVQADTAKAAGVSFREVWRWRLVDLKRVNDTFKKEDEVKINKVVASLKQDAISVVGEGIEVYSERIVASRRA
jgi:hypothetical protein